MEQVQLGAYLLVGEVGECAVAEGQRRCACQQERAHTRKWGRAEDEWLR